MTAKFGWMYRDGDEAFGSFDSREAAIADARETIRTEDGRSELGAKILVGPCKFADPQAHVCPSLDAVLEEMDQNARDNDYDFCDGEIFQPKGKAHDAELALRAVIKAWAAEFVTSEVWMLDETEEVTL